ncbi:MAG: alcohol dehydrogenase catalytic domain-containing protein, partial [Victivallaceae bacterium]|nr:alcohol dehydrogenase catalytic domain-containing protein [Victivallaceae bacterium]
MTQKVKAAVMVEPGRIEIQEFPYPQLKDERAMILKMEMSGVCGTDKHTFEGRSKQYAGTAAETDTPFPIIPGHENVGIVAEIGSIAAKEMEFYGRELKVGDRVTMSPDTVCGKCWYCRNTFGYPRCEHMKAYGNAFSSTQAPYLFGGWAEYMYILPNTFIYKVPDTMPPEVGVLAEVFTVSFAVDRAKEAYSLANEGFGAADTVVIQGVGPLGLGALIKARMLGAGDIIAIDRSAFRLNMAGEFTADYTLNIDTTTREERIAGIMELTHGRGADLVVECTGSPHAVIEGLDMLRKGGTYIEAGNFVDTGTTEININRHLCAKNVRLFGVTNHPFT